MYLYALKILNYTQKKKKIQNVCTFRFNDRTLFSSYTRLIINPYSLHKNKNKQKKKGIKNI